MTVFADETRPFLQGARLTAWELVKDGIDTTVITDNMAARDDGAPGTSTLVVVGADRIAANGDTANKIGTYGVAILAHAHGIPFYVAAPWSTIDLATADRRRHPDRRAERRAKSRTSAGTQLVPEGAAVRNPAFDVTPHRYVDGHRHRARRRPSALRHEDWRSCCVIAARHRDVVRRDGGGRRRARPATRRGRGRVRSNVVASQVAIHREWGGVVPELASRQHVRDICGVVERALADAGVDLGVARRRGRHRRARGSSGRSWSAWLREGGRLGARPAARRA